ncbi:head GIN domain-containing protein [Flavobacterium sp.]
MKKILFSLLAISSIAFGQVTKNLGDFDKVSTFDQIDIMLIPAGENKIVITGSGAAEVEIINKNGELKIRMPFTKILSGDNISVTLYFKKINSVKANEGSRIACDEIIKSTSFEVNAKEGSEVKLKLETQKLVGRIANGSKVYLSGSASNQDILVNSGGIYEAKSLETQQTDVTCNAGGIANIFATTFVTAKVRAGGEITIFGNPKEINQKVIAGGSIEEAK